MHPRPKTPAGQPAVPVYRSLTIVGGVLRIDTNGTAHVVYRTDTTLNAPVAVVYALR